MTRRPPRSDRRLERHFEGPEILADLLDLAQCPLGLEDVREEFEAAVEEGSTPGDVLPLLWEGEPRFPSAADARRTFSNLLGLWDAIAEGQVGVLIVPEQDPAAPLSPAFVEAAWVEFDGLDERELQRDRDRYENLQADVAEFVFGRLTNCGETAQAIALDLAFECWWLCQRARSPDRVPRPSLTELEAAWERDLDPTVEPEPALAGHVTVTLWTQAADDEEPLPETDIPAIDHVLRAVRAELAGPYSPPSLS